MSDQNTKLDFVDCQMCGTTPQDSCRFCQGSEYFARIGGTSLYWGGDKNINFLKSTQYASFKKWTRALLFYGNLFLLFLVFIVSIIIELQGKKGLVFGVFTESSAGAFLFWLLLGSLLVTSFINFYRKDKTKIIKSFGLDPGPDNLLNHVDVSQSFDDDVLQTINNSLLWCDQTKNTPNTWTLFQSMLEYNQFLWLIIKMELNPQLFKDFITQRLEMLKTTGASTNFPRIYDQILVQAYVKAVELGSHEVSFNHILLAMTEVDPEVMIIFEQLKQTSNEVRKICLWQEGINQQIQRAKEYREKSKFKPIGHMNRAWTAVPTPILDGYGQDLTAMAKFEALERLIGREKEINQAINLLEKTSKNNVLFIGEAGVGKSTIVNGLAYRMAAEEVPEMLKDKRLVSLNFAQIISSGGEKLFINAINEVVRARNVILYIDDLHLLAGVKTISGGPLDALSILGESLSKYHIQFIAATSPEGYSKYISTYDSLVGDLTKVEISEVDNETAIRILEMVSYRIENNNIVLITYPAIKTAVELSADLMADRKLPAKAFDLLQECAVVVRNQKKHVVTKNDVMNLLQEKTHIPLQQVTEEESKVLLKLESELHNRVVGQDIAVKEVAEAIKRARVGLKDKHKPIASFLFVGPTGVGKTELAKSLAEIYFGQEDRMIRLDMSEYQEVGDIKKIIGAPPGSSEFVERGLLTEAVKTNPFSLVLLDELEKAYPDILNLFLQVLDEGKIKDSMGREVKFNNNIIIATSNAGSRLIQESIKQNLPVPIIEEKLLEELKKIYRPEFLNRFDGVIMFKPLLETEILQIARLMIKKINKNMSAQKISIEVTEDALQAFISQGFNQEFGARALNRTLQEKVKNVIADKMLSGELKEGKKLIITGEGQAVVE